MYCCCCSVNEVNNPEIGFTIVRDLPTEVGFTSEYGVDNTEVESTTEVGSSTDELVSTAETDEITVETGIEAASIEMEVHTAEAGGGLFTTSLHTLINKGASKL